MMIGSMIESPSIMSREEFYKFERSERKIYETSETNELYLPLTYDGFEALVEKAAQVYHFPVDDQLRSLVAGYIHHIPSDVNTISLDALVKIIYKSFSNTMTYEVDQRAKKRMQANVVKLHEDPPKNVLPISGA